MSLTQITLTTNKSISSVGNYVRKIGQGERGQVLPVLITDANGAAYNLSGKKIVFSENKNSGKFVVDDGSAADAGKITPIDLANGKFSYTLQQQVYPESGVAWFNIVSQDGTVLDTTRTFKFVVIPSTTMHVESDNYSSTLSALEAHYQGVIKNTETDTKNLINSLTEKINQAISNGQKDIADELSDAKNQLTTVLNQEKELIANWTTEFGKRKDDFDKLKADWQKQSKQVLDDCTAKIDKINSDAQSQHDAIQAKADQQLKDNGSASAAAINQLNSDKDAALKKFDQNKQAKFDEIEKAKNDAIAKVESDKQAALKKLDQDKQAKITEIQSDYKNWSAKQIADFTSRLKPLNDQITKDNRDLSDINNKIITANKSLADIHQSLAQIDFTKFVTKDQFKESMSKKANGLKVLGKEGEVIMAVDESGNINATDATNGVATFGALSTVGDQLTKAIQDGFAGIGSKRYTNKEVDKIVSDAVDQVTKNLAKKADETEIQSLTTQITTLTTDNGKLKAENDDLKAQIKKLTPVHVKSVDDVAKQDAFFVLVDDDND